MRNAVKVTIASGGTVSTVAEGQGLVPVGVYIPDAFTGTAITFKSGRPTNPGSPASCLIGDGAGASYTRTVRAGDYIPLPRDVFQGVDNLQIVSGSSEAAARELLVIFN
jgi:hypothetical protein